MSLNEVLSGARGLPRGEQLRLIQLLAAELAGDEEVNPIRSGETYPVWSPYDADEAAAVLTDLLADENRRP